MNGTNKKILNIIFTGFLWLVAIVNAGLTFMFGGTYGGETFPTALPALSFVLGGLTLTLFYDAGAFAWFVARGRDGQSNTQRAIASVMAAASMLASVMVSVMQLAMTTTLVDMSALYQPIGLLGLVVSLLMAAGHFVAIFAYQSTDPAYREADAEAELAATVADFRIAQKARVSEKMLGRVAEYMTQNVDEIAQIEAARMWGELQTHLHTSTSTALPAGDEQPVIIDQAPEPADMPAGFNGHRNLADWATQNAKAAEQAPAPSLNGHHSPPA